MDPQKTFWGLVIEQGKQYKQTPTFNFHVSRAVLDLENYDKKPVSLRVQVDNGEFVLCNLNENETQVSLDLIFSEGEKVKFFTSGGKGNVHLTGYLMPEEDLSQFDDEEFSDEDASEDEQVILNRLNQIKRKNTETVKLTGKDAKKMKTEDKTVETNAKQQKVVDVDPKQLLNKKENKPQDNQQNKKKEQQKDKVAVNSKLATKGLEMDSDSDVNDDDLSIDEDESVDLNAMMDEDSDEDLESNDDLESDDEDDIDIAKLNKMKNQNGKPNLQQANKPKQQQSAQKNKNQNKPNQQQKQKNGPFVPQNKSPLNKSPQQMNKNQQNTPNQNKNQDKPHQQTPFHHKKGNSFDFKKNSNKKNQGTPFQSGNKGNKSFGSQNKQAKKVFN